MSLGADIAAQLPFLRTQAESMMVSAGVVRRATGAMTEDPVTLEQVPAYDTIYTGIARYKAANTQAGRSEIPGAIVVDQSATLSLPVGAPGAGDVRVNDIWECTANPFDASLIGKRVRVTGVHSQTHATAHRFPVEEVL